ncbi:MAG: hypothetical protein IJS62_02610 [Bacteroidales bacterium]|nr:hypothetical protein [Bacteroidales bacterium]
MKPYSNEIKKVRAMIEELGKVRELVEDLQNGVVVIENELNSLDASLPGDAEIAVMPEGNAKTQLTKLLNLLSEAYAAVDDILGAPEDEMTGEPVGTAFSPEARGNSGSDLSLDELMRQVQHFRSKTAS